MTRVESIRMHRVTLPLVRVFRTAVRSTDTLEACLVEIVDSDGRTGWGEAPLSWRVTGLGAAAVEELVLGPLARVVVGRDPADLAALCDDVAAAVVGSPAARSAVDCALHDLAAQGLGTTVVRMLGGLDGVPLRTDMTLSATTDLASLVDLARRHVDDGFDVLKLKMARGVDSRAALAAVRVEVGTDVVLRVDANQAWTPREAVETIRSWEDADLGVQLVEQPVPVGSLAELAWVTHRIGTPVLADESIWSARDLLDVVTAGAADLVNVKLAKTGGMHEAGRVIALARTAGVGVVVGCMMESPVGIAAAAALVASAGASSGEARRWGAMVRDAAHDLDAGAWVDGRSFGGGVRYRGSAIDLSPDAGFGITGVVR